MHLAQFFIFSAFSLMFTIIVKASYEADQLNPINNKHGPPNGLTGFQTNCTKENCISLTFDDGPYNYMRDIVDQAEEVGIKVTFFINANNYDCIYNQKRVEDLRYAFKKGHQFCSHSTSHPDFNSLTKEEIKTQMKDLNDALWKIFGVKTQCMRMPYGNATQEVLDYLNNELGYVVISWNYDTRDADGATLQESKQVINQIRSPESAIILMHEPVNTTSSNLLPYSIKQLMKNGGYKKENFFTVTEALGFNGYKKVKKPSKRDPSWTCEKMPKPGPD